MISIIINPCDAETAEDIVHIRFFFALNHAAVYKTLDITIQP